MRCWSRDLHRYICHAQYTIPYLAIIHLFAGIMNRFKRREMNSTVSLLRPFTRSSRRLDSRTSYWRRSSLLWQTHWRKRFTALAVEWQSWYFNMAYSQIQEAQLNEVLSASNLDPSALTMVTRKLEV